MLGVYLHFNVDIDIGMEGIGEQSDMRLSKHLEIIGWKFDGK